MSETRDGTLGEVIDQRVQVYGDPVETFVRIAEVWSGILGHTVNPTDVPLCLIGMKLVRTTQAPDYSDNSDDVEGYLDIFRQLVGEDMIHARSVTDYLAQKNNYWRVTGRVCICTPEGGVSDCPQHGVAADNADQSRFYAENDRTKDAGPDEAGPRTCECCGEEEAAGIPSRCGSTRSGNHVWDRPDEDEDEEADAVDAALIAGAPQDWPDEPIPYVPVTAEDFDLEKK